MTEKKKTRAEIEVGVRQKVDCEEKAFRWVEHLALVDSISEVELAKMMSVIMPCHYHDINEERAISKVCGYPLCSVKLGKRSPHKYHISVKYNKVINLSVRGNFCSLYCFQASKFIENQIPQVPIWLRNEQALDIKLLPRMGALKQCGIGEVAIGMMKLNVDNPGKHCSGMMGKDECHSSDDDLEDQCLYDCLEKGFNENVNISGDNNDDEFESERINVSEKIKKSNERKQTKLIDNKDIIKGDSTETQQYFLKVTELVREWLTKASFHHLNILSKEFLDSDDEIDEESCFPDTENFQTKVTNFLSRQPEWITESSSGESKKENKRKSILPTVDSKSQNRIRRRIVHEKLAGILREVLPLCGLLEEDLTAVKFFKFVDTFNFTSKNIVLNSKQWSIMTILLLKMISKTYQKNFGDLKNRREDINNFLIMRNLPNVSQIEEIIKGISANVSYGNVDEKDNTIVQNNYNTSKRKDKNIVNKEDNSSYYYDQMEEVD